MSIKWSVSEEIRVYIAARSVVHKQRTVYQAVQYMQQYSKRSWESIRSKLNKARRKVAHEVRNRA